MTKEGEMIISYFWGEGFNVKEKREMIGKCFCRKAKNSLSVNTKRE